MGGLNTTQNQHLEKDLGQNFPDGIRFVGFENKNNICYANSALQCLYYCEQFRDKVFQYKGQDGIPASDNAILILQDLFTQLSQYKKKTGCIATKKLMNYVKKKNDMFRGEYHQDCHEFSMWLMNQIDDTLNTNAKDKNKKQNTQPQPVVNKQKRPLNWLEEIFQGKEISQTQCLKCNNITEREEPFFDISLDIECNASLSHCIKQKSRPERLEGNDKFMCDKCQCLQEATKKVLIQKFPDTLIIHLKRFKYDERLMRMTKLTWKIAFPVEMKLSQNYDVTKEDEDIYDLYGIVIHLGQGQMYGHYQSLVRIKNNWYLFDDEQISVQKEVDLFNVFGSNHFNTCAYMLFYQKRSALKTKK